MSVKKKKQVRRVKRGSSTRQSKNSTCRSEQKRIWSVKAEQDWTLIQDARQGDQHAFAKLLARYRNTIYYTMLKMVKNPDDAEDLTIEAFGRAFKSIDQYEPEFSFSTWLFRIATNNCIDFIRKKKQTISLDTIYENPSGDEYTKEHPAEMPGPEEKMIKKEKIRLMHTIVEKLRPRYRTLIEMRFFQEKSYEEIAKELDIPIGSVKAHLFRAKELLYLLMRKLKDNI